METKKIPSESGHFAMQHPKCGTVHPLLRESIAERKLEEKPEENLILFQPCTDDVYEENDI